MTVNNYVKNALVNRKRISNAAEDSKQKITFFSDILSNISNYNAQRKDYVNSLPKCQYQVSIYNKLKEVYKEEDYYSGLKYFFGMQPLEDVSEDLNDLKKTETQCIEELDGTKKCYITQPNVDLVQKGLIDLMSFIADFYQDNAEIRCKEGFSDLVFVSFVKYNNPTKFKIMKNIFNNDVDPCAAYELQEVCDPMPIGLEELHYKIVQMAPEIATSFEINHP